jgi:hypothetical protein
VPLDYQGCVNWQERSARGGASPASSRLASFQAQIREVSCTSVGTSGVRVLSVF